MLRAPDIHNSGDLRRGRVCRMLGVKFQMKISLKIHPAVLALGFVLLASNILASEVRVTQNFDANWLFLKADATNAEESAFDDSDWRKLNAPHDWSIEGPFAQTNKTGGAGGFLPSGVGWYRKHFTLPRDSAGRVVRVEFDGVMANSDVWINGFHLGHRPYGYVSFGYELTGHLNFGGDNVLAVRSDTSQQAASRWYSGAGIYRHVHLTLTDPIHFVPWGLFISTPEASPKQATVRVQLTVTNESDATHEITLQTTLVSPDGKSVASVQSGCVATNGADTELIQKTVLPKPALWNLATPSLYYAVSKIISDGETLDQVTNVFGIREFHFAADTGFWLNGRNFKIKGVCLHHDGGTFGAAVPLGVWQERLKVLKELGVNAIRTAHNPPAPEFLDLCDRMGFLVMDEFFDCWTVGKNPYDYHLYFNEWSKTDERDTILRDRNHPSIILYSVGNEIHDTPKAELAKGILKGLVEVAHETDPTRPVTQALFRPNVSGDYTNGLADLLDVIGTNYRDNELQAAQRARPSRKIIGTEQRHDRQTWLWLRDSPSEAGQFLWSGIDYLGESRRWPIVAAGSGLLDRTGAPKPMAYERASWWLAESKPADTNAISPPSRSALRRGSLRPRGVAGEDWWVDKPMVSITRRTGTTTNAPADPGFSPLDRRQVLFADWTPKNLQPHEETVEVYSNCKEVELFLNGKSLGKQPLHADASPRGWKVNFAPGTLKAVARNDGRVVATDELRTAGPAAKIRLTTNLKKLANGRDGVAFVRAAVVDLHGVPVPSADVLVSFNISGPGVVAAVDNADNASHEPFQATERHAFAGKCIAFVKATAPSGKIVVTASAPGLQSGRAVIQAARPPAAP